VASVTSALLAVVLALGALPTTLAAQDTGRQDEVRALWVTHMSLASPSAIATMVRSAKGNHFNTLLVQVRARGEAYFSDALEPRAAALDLQPASFDPLGTVLALAHAAGLRVHAWVNVGLVSSAVDLPASRAHVVNRHPEWLMVPRAISSEMALLDPKSQLYRVKLARWIRGQSAEIEGLYLSPIPAAAADHMVAVVSDLTARYAVDGVHLDYARYPNDDFDYSREALLAFASDVASTLAEPEARRLQRRASTAPLAWVEAFPERWREYRRARLTTLVTRLASAAKEWRPTALVSAAVYPDAGDAATRRLQDWQVWLANGSLDVVCPMAYATDVPTFTQQITSARTGAGKRPLWAGIAAYRLTSTQTIENIQIARRVGVDGIVLFSYDSLTSAPNGAEYLAQVGQAAFAR